MLIASIFALYKSVASVEEYNMFNCMVSRYNNKKYFDIVGNCRTKRGDISFQNDTTINLEEAKLSCYQKKTISLISFSDDEPDTICSFNNIICSVNGNMNIESTCMRYGLPTNIANEEFIVKAYLANRNTFTIGKSFSMTNIIDEVDGDFSIILIDNSIGKAFIYRRNIPLYYRDVHGLEGLFISTDNFDIGSSSIMDESRLIPNNTGMIISLDNMMVVETFKSSYYRKKLNGRFVAVLVNMPNILYLKDIDQLFNPTVYLSPNSIESKVFPNRILAKLEYLKIESKNFVDYSFVLGALDYVIENNIGTILIPNIGGSSTELIRIAKEVLVNSSADINVYPIYTMLTSDSYNSSYDWLNIEKKFAYHLDILKHSGCSDDEERRFKSLKLWVGDTSDASKL